MPRPTHCLAEQHVIFWINDIYGVCDGHPKTVWKYNKNRGQHGGWTIQGDWNETAVELAQLLVEKIKDGNIPTPQYVLPDTPPAPMSIEPIPEHARYIMRDFFSSRGMGQRHAAQALEISRGLWSDIVTGRRPVTQKTWMCFRRLHASS